MSYVVSTSTRARNAGGGQGGDGADAVHLGHAQVHEDHVGVERARAASPPRTPSPASPTTSNSGARAANMPLRPLRTTGWSSTIITRIGCAHVAVSQRAPRGWRRRSAVPPSGSDSTSQRARHALHALAHRRQPEAARSLAGTPGAAAVDGGEADAVVADVERDQVLHVGQRQARRGVASACLATLASASWAVRSSATSISGRITRGVPVVVNDTSTPCSSDHRRATSWIASGSRAPASGSGRSACDRAARLGEALAREVDRQLEVPRPAPPPRRRRAGRPAAG